MNITTIQFPEIKLATRDGHKLRGYFGQLFKEHSPLLHNHFDDGGFRYRYPLVQYKVLNGTPSLVGIGEGAALLVQLFLKIKEIDIDGKRYATASKQMQNTDYEPSFDGNLHKYRFDTLWMGLNQKNYPEYMNLPEQDRAAFLNHKIQNHILAFFKAVNYHCQERIMVIADLQEANTNFKGQRMTVFSGTFVTNAVLPNFVGIGKSTARGFGSISVIK